MATIKSLQRSVRAQPGGRGQEITDPGFDRVAAAGFNPAPVVAGLQSVGNTIEEIAVDNAKTRATEAFNTAKQSGLDQTVADELSKTGVAAEGMTGRVKDAYEKAYTSQKLRGLESRLLKEQMQREGASVIGSATRREAGEFKKRRDAARLDDVENESNRVHAMLVDTDGITNSRAVLAGLDSVRERAVAATQDMDEASAETYGAKVTTDYFFKLFKSLEAANRIKEAESILVIGSDEGMIQETHDRLLKSIEGVADTEQAYEDFDSLMDRSRGDLQKALELAKKLPSERRKSVESMIDHEVTKKRSLENDVRRQRNREQADIVGELISPLRDHRLTTEENLLIDQALSKIQEDPDLSIALERRVAQARAGKRILVSDPDTVDEIHDVIYAEVLDLDKVQAWSETNWVDQQFLTEADQKRYTSEIRQIASTGGPSITTAQVAPWIKAFAAQQAPATGQRRKNERLAERQLHEKEFIEAVSNEARQPGGFKSIKQERLKEINDFIMKERAIRFRPILGIQMSIGGETFRLSELSDLSKEQVSLIKVPDEDSQRLRTRMKDRNLIDLAPDLVGDDRDLNFKDLPLARQRDFVQFLYVQELFDIHRDLVKVPSGQ